VTRSSQHQQSSPDVDSRSFRTGSPRQSGDLTRRDWLASAALAGGAALGLYELYDLKIGPALQETTSRSEELCGGAITVSASYDAHFDGMSRSCSIQFAEPGSYKIDFSTSSGAAASRTVSFAVERDSNGALNFTRSVVPGEAERCSSGEFGDFLASLQSRPRASTQLKFEYRAPSGQLREGTSFF
jgi:hypothetical protein